MFLEFLEFIVFFILPFFCVCVCF